MISMISCIRPNQTYLTHTWHTSTCPDRVPDPSRVCFRSSSQTENKGWEVAQCLIVFCRLFSQRCKNALQFQGYSSRQTGRSRIHSGIRASKKHKVKDNVHGGDSIFQQGSLVPEELLLQAIETDQSDLTISSLGHSLAPRAQAVREGLPIILHICWQRICPKSVWKPKDRMHQDDWRFLGIHGYSRYS